MALKLITAPTSEPVSLEEAKAHLRVTDSNSDEYISGLIAASRELVESFTRRQIKPATWELYLDAFPTQRSYPFMDANEKFIYLPRAPLTAVSFIKYYDLSNTLQTLDASTYDVDAASEPGRIFPSYGNIWPLALPKLNGVTIRFTCGYTTAGLIPEKLKHAIKLMVGNLWVNREPVLVGSIATELPLSLKTLLWSDRVFDFNPS